MWVTVNLRGVSTGSAYQVDGGEARVTGPQLAANSEAPRGAVTRKVKATKNQDVNNVTTAWKYL